MIKDNTHNVLAEVDRRTTTALQKAEELLIANAKRVVTVKTGALRDSIQGQVAENTLTVGSPLGYAAKVEMDKPYLRVALAESKTAIKEIFKR